MENKVFLLSELLEPILGYLPQRDLLLVQRVSKRWQTLITSSKPLQRKLFFQPKRTCPLPKSDLLVQFNPLLQETFPHFFGDKSTYNVADPSDDLADDLGEFTGSAWVNHEIESVRDQPWFQCDVKRAVVLREDASWRKMFMSDPPPRIDHIAVWLSGCCYGGKTLGARIAPEFDTTARDEGLRMGLVWDVIAFISDDNPAGDFGVAWWRGTEPEEEEESGTTCQWSLGLQVETEHSWQCYRAEEAYGQSGYKIVQGDIVTYEGYGKYKDNLMDLEATPLSVRRKHE